MVAVDKTSWEILNATADDWENLEEIYQLVCFDLSSEEYDRRASGAYYLRPAKEAPPLQEIADRIVRLVSEGLLEVKREDEPACANPADLSYVWRGWFAMTPQGRSAWAASDPMVTA